MKTSKNLLSKRALRAPFVITVAAGVALGTVGCGQVAGGGDECGDELACNPPPVNPPPTNPPPVQLECPVDTPKEGASCDARSDACSYGDCYGSPDTRAECRAGVWRVSRSSCNPPMPVCPEEAPTGGEACSPDGAARACTYGDCDGEPTITATCTDGAWAVAERTCNPPPPPECPVEAPVHDSSCPHEGQECGYADSDGQPAIEATCTDGTWLVEPAPPAVE